MNILKALESEATFAHKKVRWNDAVGAHRLHM
jgi:hypothetical protein